jgi:hypothetical protein
MSTTADLDSRAPAGLDELDAPALLTAATDAAAARRAAEVAEMRVAAQWAALHGEPRGERDPMTMPGGEGTPEVREYALPELAMARDTHTATTRALIADTLDLQHRLPLTWARVVELACEPWVARRVATLSRSVPAATVGIVDRAVAAAITGHAPSTVLQIAQAKTVEADPEGPRDASGGRAAPPVRDVVEVRRVRLPPRHRPGHRR